MLKALIVAVISLPLLAASALAQGQSSEHHYQGGPKTEVPHHIGTKPTGKATGQQKPSQAGQHHYQGGPQSIHHIGEYPKAKAEAPKSKRKKGKKSS
jgi:hypothetical protein